MTSVSATRASLLVRVRDLRDQAAWGEFVRLYAPLVHAYGLHRGLQDADSADLAQEVIRKAARSLPEFRYEPGRGSFRGWLYTVTRNELRKLVARNSRRALGSGESSVQELLQQQSDPAADEASWDREHERNLLRWALERVRPEFRETTWQGFWQTAVEGRPAGEVANCLGVSVGAVYIARSRVTARIREEIEAAGSA
jgi:RNA polymerase sigma-70 factor (ECF subfamily)